MLRQLIRTFSILIFAGGLTSCLEFDEDTFGLSVQVYGLDQSEDVAVEARSEGRSTNVVVTGTDTTLISETRKFNLTFRENARSYNASVIRQPSSGKTCKVNNPSGAASRQNGLVRVQCGYPIIFTLDSVVPAASGLSISNGFESFSLTALNADTIEFDELYTPGEFAYLTLSSSKAGCQITGADTLSIFSFQPEAGAIALDISCGLALKVNVNGINSDESESVTLTASRNPLNPVTHTETIIDSGSNSSFNLAFVSGENYSVVVDDHSFTEVDPDTLETVGTCLFAGRPTITEKPTVNILQAAPLTSLFGTMPDTITDELYCGYKLNVDVSGLNITAGDTVDVSYRINGQLSESKTMTTNGIPAVAFGFPAGNNENNILSLSNNVGVSRCLFNANASNSIKIENATGLIVEPVSCGYDLDVNTSGLDPAELDNVIVRASQAGVVLGELRFDIDEEQTFDLPVAVDVPYTLEIIQLQGAIADCIFSSSGTSSVSTTSVTAGTVTEILTCS